MFRIKKIIIAVERSPKHRERLGETPGEFRRNSISPIPLMNLEKGNVGDGGGAKKKVTVR